MKKLKELFLNYIDYVLSLKSGREAYYTLMPFLIPLTLVFLLLVFLASNWDSRIVWMKDKLNPNHIVVETVNLSNEDIIEIGWACGLLSDTLVIYEDNQVINLDFKNTGKNIFMVYVNEHLVFEESQFKPVFWEGYTYTFTIEKVYDDFEVHMEITD